MSGRPFVKMNGCGNDFVVVDALSRPFAPTSHEARAIADRSAGQGCDQLIAIEPSPTADAFMRVWNADGGTVETCGNALRCVGWMLMEAGGRGRVTIDTLGGPTVATRAGAHRVTVDMGAPRLDWTEIPLAEEMDTRGIELQVGPIDAPVLHTPGAVSMGNPHVVFLHRERARRRLRAGRRLPDREPSAVSRRGQRRLRQVEARDRIRARASSGSRGSPGSTP
jgi:diaminopimelate epimerase